MSKGRQRVSLAGKRRGSQKAEQTELMPWNCCVQSAKLPSGAGLNFLLTSASQGMRD